MMDARFTISAPEKVRITMTLTAPAEEWEKIRQSLDQSPSGTYPDILGRQIRDAISTAQAALYSERWTTGYATGEVEQ